VPSPGREPAPVAATLETFAFSRKRLSLFK
jgi:hypothetical protein